MLGSHAQSYMNLHINMGCLRGEVGREILESFKAVLDEKIC